MVKILYIDTFSKYGASGIFFRQTIKHLKREMNIKIITESFSSTLYTIIPNIIYLFKKFIMPLREDELIHAQYGSGCGFYGLFYKGKKIISIRGSDVLSSRLIKYSWKFFFWEYFKTEITFFYLKFYDRIIVMSNELKKVLLDRGIKVKINIIPDPINPKKFYPIDRNFVRRKLNLDLKKFYIFIPIINKKNFEKNYQLVKKIMGLFKDHRNYSFLLADNNIKHEDMVYYYNACNCTILTSYYEGWPNSIKESLYCDTPVITTNVSDLLKLSKKTNFIKISNADELNFAKYIIHFCKIRRPKNLNRILKDMSLENFTKKIYKIYNSLDKRIIKVQ